MHSAENEGCGILMEFYNCLKWHHKTEGYVLMVCAYASGMVCASF